MATLKDVANEAGVSIATVSCCLSGTKNVKPETRQKILDAIDKLNYVPNASARSLRKNKSNNIGVVLTNIGDPYYTEVFKGISSSLSKKGYFTNVAFSNNIANAECEIIDEFVSHNVAGLIVVTSMPENTEFFKNHVLKYNIPIIFIDRKPENLDVGYISFDNESTSYYLTDILLKNGYRRIGLVTGPDNFSCEIDSIKGFSDAYEKNNKPFDHNLIQMTDMSKESAFKVVLSNYDFDTLEAIITTSESISYGVLEALETLKIKFPDKIRFITYGEERWNRSSIIPGILSTSRSAFGLGEKAARHLLFDIDTEEFHNEQVLLKDKILYENISFPKPVAKFPFHIPEANKKSPIRILMVDLPTSRAAKLLSRNFTIRTGIPVEIDLVPHNVLLNTIFEDSISTDSKYDIYMYDLPWLEYLVQNDVITDISEYISEGPLKKDVIFYQNLVNCKHNGRYYGFPIVSGAQILFYRKDLFENNYYTKTYKQKYQFSLRAPRTWQEFNNIAEFFTRKYNPESPTEYGTSFTHTYNEEMAPELLIRMWSYGGDVWDRSLKACLDSPQNKKAFASLLQTLNYIERMDDTASISNSILDFSKGKTAMIVTYSEYAAEISKSIRHNLIGQVGYDQLPGRTPASIGWNLGISIHSKNTDDAYKYFDWLSREDISFYMTTLDGQSAAVASYKNHELTKLYPWLELTQPSFKYCKKRTGPYYKNALVIPESKIEEIICNAFRDIAFKGVPMDEAFEIHNREMVGLFKSYGYPLPIKKIR